MRQDMDYHTAASRIKASLELGIMAEDGNPALEATITRLAALPPEDIAWIAAWLAGEGFGTKTQDFGTHVEYGVKWVDVTGVARPEGYIETGGTTPGGDIVSHFTLLDCRYIAGARQKVVSRTRRTLTIYTDWKEVTDA